MSSVDDGVNTASYTYNPDGIRVRMDAGGVYTKYLIDPFNPTGYAQVFRAEAEGSDNTVYILGHDVVAQAYNTPQI